MEILSLSGVGTTAQRSGEFPFLRGFRSPVHVALGDTDQWWLCLCWGMVGLDVFGVIPNLSDSLMELPVGNAWWIMAELGCFREFEEGISPHTYRAHRVLPQSALT